MPVSYEHESILELFRERKSLAVELLADALGVRLPEWATISISEAELGQTAPVEARADLVLVLRNAAGDPVFALVVEVQLRKDEAKRYRLPLYGCTLRDRHRCPVVVLVVTSDPEVAKWAAKPIRLGPGSTFRVAVLGPKQIPLEVAEGAPAELVLLSTKAHLGDEDAAELVFDAFLRLVDLDPDERGEYTDRLWAWLTPILKEQVQQMLRDHFPYPQSDFAKEHYGKGLEEGRREAQLREANLVLRQLERRFGSLSEATEARVRSADPDALERWSLRLLDATTLEEVFRDD